MIDEGFISFIMVLCDGVDLFGSGFITYSDD